MKKKSILILFVWFLIVVGCRKMAYIPDENGVIHIQAVPPVISPAHTATVVIYGEKGTGYPLPDGTVVYLSTSSGQIDREVVLVSGRAETLFRSDPGFVGEVQVTARCGKAAVSPDPLVITVVDVEIAYLFVDARPPVLPPGGGTSQITVTALDSDMEAVAGRTLWLETDAGSLSGGGRRVTDADGRVEAKLTTGEETTVTVKYKEIEASVTLPLEAPNQRPSAVFVYSPKNPKSGEPVYFNAAESSDPDGFIVHWQWDFGDGSHRTGEYVSHTYRVDRTKTFVVTLKVKDDRGGEDTESREITIQEK